MKTEITPGQTFDYLGFDLVMADNLPERSVLLDDRGYDADSIWKKMEAQDTQNPHAKITEDTDRCGSLAVFVTQPCMAPLILSRCQIERIIPPSTRTMLRVM